MTCDNCGGHGRDIGAVNGDWEPCRDCDGSGLEPEQDVTMRIPLGIALNAFTAALNDALETFKRTVESR
jgi:DnaJ-class molecular chaperone